MPGFTIEEVVAATQGIIRRVKDNQFKGVITDTRKIQKDALFIALQGEKFDGHDFLGSAIANGASGVIISKNYSKSELENLDATIIEVEDTLVAYQSLAKAHRKRFSIPVIAITGSNGKTTTKDLTAAILSSKFNVLKTQANFNNEIGLPLTLLQMDRVHDVAVVEMGMRGFNQIRQLANVALPTIGIVTNVGETHMELLGSMENIALAKAELVEEMDTGGFVILNGDNSYVKQMKNKVKGDFILFGCGDDCKLNATKIETNNACTKFSCDYRGKVEEFTLPMVGRHNVYNALAAIAVAEYLNLTADEVRCGLFNFTASGMRLAVMQVKNYTVINDAYNASPMSMMAAIDTLKEVAKDRSVAVLGDMLELGDISEQSHKKVGQKLVQAGVNIVVAVGEMSKWIVEEAQKGAIVAIHCKSHNEAGVALRKLLKAKDTILFKGSRGMQMEKVIDLL